jgi:hypothetical protein
MLVLRRRHSLALLTYLKGNSGQFEMKKHLFRIQDNTHSVVVVVSTTITTTAVMQFDIVILEFPHLELC